MLEKWLRSCGLPTTAQVILFGPAEAAILHAFASKIAAAEDAHMCHRVQQVCNYDAKDAILPASPRENNAYIITGYRRAGF